MDLGDASLASPADFAEADDIITNVAKKGQPWIELIIHTPKSLIITGVLIYWGEIGEISQN